MDTENKPAPKVESPAQAAGLQPDPGDPLAELSSGFRGLLAATGELTRVELDRLRAAISRFVRRMVLACAALLMCFAVCVAGSVLAIRGVSDLLASATGRPWLGNILAGIGACAAAVLAVLGADALHAARRRRHALEKYSGEPHAGQPATSE